MEDGSSEPSPPTTRSRSRRSWDLASADDGMTCATRPPQHRARSAAFRQPRRFDAPSAAPGQSGRDPRARDVPPPIANDAAVMSGNDARRPSGAPSAFAGPQAPRPPMPSLAPSSRLPVIADLRIRLPAQCSATIATSASSIGAGAGTMHRRSWSTHDSKKPSWPPRSRPQSLHSATLFTVRRRSSDNDERRAAATLPATAGSSRVVMNGRRAIGRDPDLVTRCGGEDPVVHG